MKKYLKTKSSEQNHILFKNGKLFEVKTLRKENGVARTFEEVISSSHNDRENKEYYYLAK